MHRRRRACQEYGRAVFEVPLDAMHSLDLAGSAYFPRRPAVQAKCYSMDSSKDFSIKSEHGTVLRLAEVDCIVENRLEDGLKIGRRTAYNP